MVVGMVVHMQFPVDWAVYTNWKDEINKDRSDFQTLCLHIETDIKDVYLELNKDPKLIIL